MAGVIDTLRFMKRWTGFFKNKDGIHVLKAVQAWAKLLDWDSERWVGEPPMVGPPDVKELGSIFGAKLEGPGANSYGELLKTQSTIDPGEWLAKFIELKPFDSHNFEIGVMLTNFVHGSLKDLQYFGNKYTLYLQEQALEQELQGVNVNTNKNKSEENK